jgi:dTMP kinase
MKNEFFISVIGLDGSGKSTCIEVIESYLKKEKSINLITCDAMKPGRFTPQLANVSKQLSTELFDVYTPEFIGASYAMDLIANLEDIVLPALHKGMTVISHRSDVCCLAYSRAMGGQSKVIDRIIGQCPKPDLYIFLDIDEQTAINRVIERSVKTGNEIKFKEKVEIFQKARSNYYEILKNRDNVIIIDGRQDVTQVINSVKSEVNKLFTLESSINKARG